VGFLRLILAISVIVAHSDSFLGLTLVGGQHAVQIFFMISGFYMALILNTKYVGVGSYKLFLINRALKIYPMYIISILIVMLISISSFWIFKSNGSFAVYIDNFDDMNLSSVLFLIASNVIVFGQDLVMFLGVNLEDGTLFFTPNFRDTSPPLYKFLLNPPAWSIAVELMFYLIAPFLMTKKTYILITVAILSLTLKFGLSYYFNLEGDPWSYRFFPSELSFFVLGSIGYKIYSGVLIERGAYPKTSYSLFALMSLAVLFYVQLGSFYNILYFLAFISIPFIFNLTKGWSVDRSVGDLSYPVYILHYPILLVVNKCLSILMIEGWASEITVFLSILTSIVAMRFIIKPIDVYREKNSKRLIQANESKMQRILTTI
jgi:peptidoglycan/LPS O-acetylase OafA/YrhL